MTKIRVFLKTGLPRVSRDWSLGVKYPHLLPCARQCPAMGDHRGCLVHIEGPEIGSSDGACIHRPEASKVQGRLLLPQPPPLCHGFHGNCCQNAILEITSTRIRDRAVCQSENNFWAACLSLARGEVQSSTLNSRNACWERCTRSFNFFKGSPAVHSGARHPRIGHLQASCISCTDTAPVFNGPWKQWPLKAVIQRALLCGRRPPNVAVNYHSRMDLRPPNARKSHPNFFAHCKRITKRKIYKTCLPKCAKKPWDRKPPQWFQTMQNYQQNKSK